MLFFSLTSGSSNRRRVAAPSSSREGAPENSTGNLIANIATTSSQGTQNTNLQASSSSSSSSSSSHTTTKVSLIEDRTTAKLPFLRPIIVRIISYILSMPNPKVPKPVLRLLAVFCRYKKARISILYTLMNILLIRPNALEYLDKIPFPVDGNDPNSVNHSRYIQDTQSISSLVASGLSEVCLRRLLNCIAYLIRKTESLVWYDMMSVQVDTNIIKKENSMWMFEELILFLSTAESTIDLDGALHLIECLCNCLGKLSISQANDLVMKASDKKAKIQLEIGSAEISDASCSMKSPPLKKRATSLGGESNTISKPSSRETTIGLESSAVPVSEETKSNVSQAEQASDPTPISNSDGFQSTLCFDLKHSQSLRYYCGRRVGQSGYKSPCGSCDGTCGPTHGCQCISCSKLQPTPSDLLLKDDIIESCNLLVDIPFPVLSPNLLAALASIAGSNLSGGTMRKQVQRIFSYLSLYDSNWIGLLSELSKKGSVLASLASSELAVTHEMLQRVVELKGDAAYALSLPELSTPSSVAELRLLLILRLMISLRTENLEKYGQSAPVAFAIEQIDFSGLWDLLLESLEYVRGLEGILEIEAKLEDEFADDTSCLLYTSPSPRDRTRSRMPSSA